MFANIVVGKGFLVRVVETLVTGIGLVLLVLCPRDSFGVEQVDDIGNVGGDTEEVIRVHTHVIARDGSKILIYILAPMKLPIQKKFIHWAQTGE